MTRVLVPLAACSSPRGSGSQWPLLGNEQVGRQRVQIENLADEVSERGNEFSGFYFAPRGQISRGPRGQAHLLFGSEKNHVGQCSFHRVAN
ncbi:MAG: hypothetical protein ACXW2G_03640, partial [Burkholderiaceae bacterium]